MIMDTTTTAAAATSRDETRRTKYVAADDEVVMTMTTADMDDGDVKKTNKTTTNINQYYSGRRSSWQHPPSSSWRIMTTTTTTLLWCYYIALFCCILNNPSVTTEAAEVNDDDMPQPQMKEISYVLEPYEDDTSTTSSTSLLRSRSLFDLSDDGSDSDGGGGGGDLTAASGDSLLVFELTMYNETEDVLFGESALQINYNDNNDAVVAKAASGSPNAAVARFGWVPNDSHRRYSCVGATHISFWYKILHKKNTTTTTTTTTTEVTNDDDGTTDSTSTVLNQTNDDATAGVSSSDTTMNLRFVLLDSSNVNCILLTDENNNDNNNNNNNNNVDDGSSGRDCTSNPDILFEHYYSSEYVLQSSEEWTEIRIPLDNENFKLAAENGGRGVRGNGMLDLYSLKGWYYELSPSSTTSTADTAAVSSESSSIVSILIDQLACVGGEDLLAASLHIGVEETFDTAVAHDIWYPEYYQSELSEKQTITTLRDGILTSNYTIEQAETWGGFVSYGHISTDQSYYNLSQATSVSLQYNITNLATPSNRAHLRMILFDTSDCIDDCSSVGNNNLERYYSFHNILDESGLGIIKVPLVGTSNPSSPFWRTGYVLWK